MKKVLNKSICIIAMFVCCIICGVIFNTTSFAEYSILAECKEHKWEYYRDDLPSVYVSETQCCIRYVEYRRCSRCNYKEQTAAHSENKNHIFVTNAISCNGKMQTIRVRCSNCQYTYTQSKVCPAGPHANGSCPALTLGLKPEECIE